MIYKRTINNLVKLLIFTILILFFFNNRSYADTDCSTLTQANYVECYYDTISDSARNRYRECIDGKPKGIAQPVLIMSKTDYDLEVDLTNPVCIAHIAALYATFKGALLGAAIACKTAWPSPFPDPLGDARFLFNIHYQAGAQAAAAIGNPALATSAAWCGVATAAADLALTAFAIDAVVTRAVAAGYFNQYRVCGSNWKKYDEESWEKTTFDLANKALTAWDNSITAGASAEDNIKWREWVYQGIERESHTCKDINGDPLKYYFRGFLMASHNCHSYIDDTELYNCCLEDQKKICIEKYNDDDKSYITHGFCKANSGICYLSAEENLETYTIAGGATGATVGGGVGAAVGSAVGAAVMTLEHPEFSIETLYNGSVLCASTYDLCPYNFNVGGGTEHCALKTENCDPNSDSYNNDDNKCNKCLNYCQMFEHCVTIDNGSYVYQNSISSPYFSQACINMKGDSKNSDMFQLSSLTGTELSSTSQRNFSAPIAQCIKETLENVFYGKAGHTKCDYGVVDKDGNCTEGTMLYKEGDGVEGGSFFSKLQDKLRTTITMAIVFSMMFVGFKIFLGDKKVLTKTELIHYIVKIGLILYFTTGQGWQSGFFDGVYNASSSISGIFTELGTSTSPEKQDGCQFDHDSLTTKFQGTEHSPNYPAGKSYLAIWDTMDCKIAKQLGDTGNGDFSAIGWIILSHFLIGPWGIIMAVFLSIFAILLIVTTIKMLHVFLASAFSIIILVYISIIIIPLTLFKKTQNLFKQWSANLLGLSLQPILLFAYIGIFISIFDNVMLGSSSYNLDENGMSNGQQNCEMYCYGSDGKRFYFQNEIDSEDATSQTCGDDAQIFDPETDSIACIIKSKTGLTENTPTGLEIFGIGFSLIGDLISNPTKVFNQAIALLKGCLILFILSKFITDIPTIAAQLIGGSAMKTPDLDTFTTTVKDKDTIVKKAFKTANAIGKRGAGAIDKAGGRKVKDAMSKGGKKAVEGGIRKIKDKLTGGKKDGASKTKEAAKPASDGDRAS